MAESRLSGKLAVILHADVADSTGLVQQNEHIAHERIQETYRRFGDTITKYHGHVCELRGDALLAEFERASGAVSAALAFQSDHDAYLAGLDDGIRPRIRVGIALGEVVIADATMTGESVVLAQRLEQLAAPGDVVIQAVAYETIPSRFPFEYEDLGEHPVKGFAKPVRAWSARLKKDSEIPPPERVRQRFGPTHVALACAVVAIIGVALIWFKPWEMPEELASPNRMALPLPDKPSIAVLPLTNMSDDASQEYFADGMTEDLITDLSKLAGLFVIARNSSFSYKGQAVKVQQVAEELGVRYVLEGSVRRVGDQVRINAQLIDATTGGHLWAERYDGNLSDVFGLQDQVVGHIVSALEITLTDVEQTRLARIPTQNLEAYDYYLRAERGFYIYSGDGRREALKLYGKAVTLDPQFADAYAGIARAASAVWRWDESNVLPGPVARKIAYGAASKALALDPDNAKAYAVLSSLQVADGKHSEALESVKKAVSLHPNNAEVYTKLADVFVYSGRHAEALAAMETAFRLEPRPPPRYYADLGWVLFWNRQYEKAIGPLEKGLAGGVEWWGLYAMTYAMLGRHEEAKAMLNKIYQVFPGASLAYNRAASRFKRAEDTEHKLEALRKAGMPEWPMGFEAPAGSWLDPAAIEALTFGRTWIGKDEIEDGPFVMEFGKNGEASFRNPGSLLVGTAWTEDGRLCIEFPALGATSRVCNYLYSNPGGTPEAQNEYILLGLYQVLTFSISQ